MIDLPDSPKKFTRDKESKIDSILTATIELAEERGYGNFSVNDIPKKAGLSIGTVYRYFPQGKPGILQEIVKRNIGRLTALRNLEKVSDSNFNKFWSEMVTEYVVGHREKRYRLSELGLTYGPEDAFTKDLRPIIIQFYQKFAKQFRKLKIFKDVSDHELLVKIAMTFGIMGTYTKSQVKKSFFESDNRLIEYLNAISHTIFKLK